MKTFRCPRPWPWWRWGLTGLSALGLALSSYLGWYYLVGGAVIGCGGGSPCNQVLNSRWSSVGGMLPVSGLAAGAYLALLVASFFIGAATEAPVRRLAWRAMLVLVGAVAGSAVWFIILQKWVIGSFCPYCLATHISGLLLATLVIWRAPKQLNDSSKQVQSCQPTVHSRQSATEDCGLWTVDFGLTGRMPAMGFASVGLVLASIMAICQATITSTPEYRAGESKDTLPAIDTHNAPLIGSPDAPYVVTLLFDYKCPHCQRLHLMLDEAIHRYGGKLAFALCPTPLNTRCNPYIPKDADEFKDSCELAKIGLAVWVAKREAFPAFDRWMFSFESGDRWQPRSLDAARSKAVELVGQAKFGAAMADPWISQYLQTCVRVYGATVQSASNPQRATAVPKLVFGSRWVIPEPNDADNFVLILRDSLTVPKP